MNFVAYCDVSYFVTRLVSCIHNVFCSYSYSYCEMSNPRQETQLQARSCELEGMYAKATPDFAEQTDKPGYGEGAHTQATPSPSGPILM